MHTQCSPSVHVHGYVYFPFDPWQKLADLNSTELTELAIHATVCHMTHSSLCGARHFIEPAGDFAGAKLTVQQSILVYRGKCHMHAARCIH